MLETVLTGIVVLFSLMCILWLINVRTKNAAIVDVGWGNGFAILAAIYAFMGDGLIDRRWLMLVMAVVWGERLTLHLLFDRILTTKPEDGRYVAMREKWKTNINRKFFFFFQFQTVLVVALSVPFLLMSVNPAPEIHWLEWTGAAIWLVGLAGETLADRQLRKFRDNPANKGKVCEVGLWNYSRHPNYFFEWVIWVGFAVTALASPYGWIALICPIAMWYILTKVTGVALTEEHALRSRGEVYREYQRTTSAFVPWLKKT